MPRMKNGHWLSHWKVNVDFIFNSPTRTNRKHFVCCEGMFFSCNATVVQEAFSNQFQTFEYFCMFNLLTHCGMALKGYLVYYINGVWVMWCLGKLIHWRCEMQQGIIYLQMLYTFISIWIQNDIQDLALVKRDPIGMNRTSRLGFKYIWTHAWIMDNSTCQYDVH